MLEHQPAAQRSFDEVKREIASVAPARGLGAGAQGRPGEARETAQGRGRRREMERAAACVTARCAGPAAAAPGGAADTSKLPAYVGVPARRRLRAATHLLGSRRTGQGRRSASRPCAAQLYGTAQFEAMLDSLRSRADIEINPANLEKK